MLCSAVLVYCKLQCYGPVKSLCKNGLVFLMSLSSTTPWYLLVESQKFSILILPSSTICVPSARICRCNMHLPLDCYFLNRKNSIDIYTWTRQSVYCNSTIFLSNTSILVFTVVFFFIINDKIRDQKKKLMISNVKMDIKLSSTTYFDNLAAVDIPKLSL